MSIYRLENSLISSHWGCRESMVQLFGFVNPQRHPMAELWMGAHPGAPSKVMYEGQEVALNDLISAEPKRMLGLDAVAQFEGRLPYLFKVLSAQSPLSIQCHPNKDQALSGWKRENDLGIALDATNRTYRDDNHKPELVYALTPYKALNGFRPISEIIELWNDLESSALNSLIQQFRAQPSEEGLKAFYHLVMTYPNKAELVETVVNSSVRALETTALSNIHKEAYELVLLLNEYYPLDIGVLSALMLNYVVLQPGESMFLKAGTLHAYLSGTALEIMANSDNVIRGGLTPKHVDIEELLKTVSFEPLQEKQLKLQPLRFNAFSETYSVPAPDFTLTVITLDDRSEDTYYSSQADIMFVIEGSITAVSEQSKIEVRRGESCFIPACTEQYQLSGKAKVAIASCGL